MFAILFRVEAKPGKRQKLLDFLKWDCDVCMKEEPRTLRFDVLQDPVIEQAFYVYEAYEDIAAFVEEHQKNAPFRLWKSRQFRDEVIAEDKKLFEGAPLALRLPLEPRARGRGAAADEPKR